MPNNAEQKHDSSMSDMLSEVLSEWRKSLMTALPGVIESYDPATKRASVQPAIKTELRGGGSVDMPVLPDVPVLFPGGGGWSLAVEKLDPGEPVMLVFCQRGIGAFKKTFGVEDTSGGVLQLDAAVALAGFGALNIAVPSGIALQNDAGTVKIEASDAGALLKTEHGTMELATDGNVKCSGTVTALDFIWGAVPTTASTHMHPTAAPGAPSSPTPGT